MKELSDDLLHIRSAQKLYIWLSLRLNGPKMKEKWY